MDNNYFIFIGDSLTYGYGVNKTINWVEKINNFESFNVINKGVNGNTTVDMLNRFTEDVINLLPQRIFIMGGTNDLLSNRSINTILENIELMLKEALNITKEVIVGIPPIILKEDAYRLFMPSPTYDYCEKQLPLLRSSLIDLCNVYNIKYVDFYNITLKNFDKNIFIDGIHLNNLGQELIFNEFISTLNIKSNEN